MCRFTSKLHGEDKLVYNVISFHSEDILFWLFNVQPIEFYTHGKVFYLEDQPVTIMTFAKRKQTGTNSEERDGERVKVPVFETCSPPPFYEKLRNRRVIEKYDLAEKQGDFNYTFDDSLKNQPIWDEDTVDKEAADKALENMRFKNAERGYGQDL